MGMFDSFLGVPVRCEECDADLSGEEFQGKDLDCDLAHYHFGEPMAGQRTCLGSLTADRGGPFNLHTSCPECGYWNQFTGLSTNGWFDLVKDKNCQHTLASFTAKQKLEWGVKKFTELQKKLLEAESSLTIATTFLVFFGHKDALDFCGLPEWSFCSKKNAREQVVRHKKEMRGESSLKTAIGCLGPSRLALIEYEANKGRIKPGMEKKDESLGPKEEQK